MQALPVKNDKKLRKTRKNLLYDENLKNAIKTDIVNLNSLNGVGVRLTTQLNG
jgi:hypothetical protein